MPKTDGLELLDEWERLDPDLLARTIVVTAASEATLGDLDTRRVFSLVRKPFEIGQLESMVEQRVRRDDGVRTGREQPLSGVPEGRRTPLMAEPFW